MTGPFPRRSRRSSHPRWAILPIFLALSGCHEGDVEVSEAPRVGHRPAPIASGLRLDPHFDFGLRLVTDEPLRHEFLVENPTTRPVRLLGARAATPCCSAVGSLPESIPPRGRVTIPVLIRLGGQTGRRSLDFFVTTDRPDAGTLSLRVTVDALAELEIGDVAEGDPTLRIGREGRRRYRVLCRRSAQEGRDAPDSVEGQAPLTARFVGEAESRPLHGELVETERLVEVTLPATSEAGHHRGAFRLGWPDGRIDRPEVAWTVSPALRASPAALVLSPEDCTRAHAILVRSDDVPFRIVALRAPFLAGATPSPEGPATAHNIDLTFDGTRLPAGSGGTLTIETDHPDQPVVALEVFRLPDPGGPAG